MTALSTPTDEWFVHDLRGAAATLDDESVAQFRRSTGGAASRLWWVAAALLGLGAVLMVGWGPGSKPTPEPPSRSAAAVAPSPDRYQADWEAAVEERDPAFVVERRVVPMEPRHAR